MKVGIVLESELFMHGIESYMRFSVKTYVSFKKFFLKDLNQEENKKKFLESITKWKLLFVDYVSYCHILNLLRKHPDVLQAFKGKLVLLRMGNEYYYNKEDLIPYKYKSVSLVVSISIPVSVSKESFRRLILPLYGNALDGRTDEDVVKNDNLKETLPEKSII